MLLKQEKQWQEMPDKMWANVLVSTTSTLMTEKKNPWCFLTKKTFSLFFFYCIKMSLQLNQHKTVAQM